MGCPSVCCEYVLLPLTNKEADLANNQAEYTQAGNLRKEPEGKKAESERCQQLHEKQDMR